MKIVCDNCGTKYSVSDDKVRGKVFKIRCKKCEEVIVVRGSDDESTEIDPQTANCWHVVLDGQQQGPYTATQLAELVESGQITDQSHCWREGFADWKRLTEIDVLADEVQSAASSAEDEPPADQPPTEGLDVARTEVADVPSVSQGAFEAPAADEAADDDEPFPDFTTPAADEPADDGEAFSGFTAPDSSTAPPETAGDALSDMFGDMAGDEQAGDEQAGDEQAGDEQAAPSESSTEAARSSRASGADLFGGGDAGGDAGGGDLFGGAGGVSPDADADAGSGGMFPDDAAERAPSPNADTGAMTGARNESSVLFSLSNLQSLSKTGSSGGDSAPDGASAPFAPGASDGSSGLIDIKTMASVSGPLTSSEDDVDELMSMGGGFGAELGSPVLAAVAPSESSNTLMFVVIGVGAAVVLAIIGLVVVLLLDNGEEGTPTAGIDQPAVLTTGALEPETPAAPAVATPANVGAADGPTPIPIMADEEPVEDEDSEGSAGGKRRPSATKQPDESAGGDQPAKAASPAASPQRQEQVKQAANALDALLDGAVGSSNAQPRRPAKAPASAPAQGASGLPERLSRSQVQSGMNGVAGRVRRCGNGQSGTVSVAVVISGSSGRVTSANVSGQFAGTPVGSCAARAVRGARFPRFSQGSLNVRYPFQVQ